MCIKRGDTLGLLFQPRVPLGGYSLYPWGRRQLLFGCADILMLAFESAECRYSSSCHRYFSHAWVLYPLGDVVGKFLATFKEFPPRQKGASFTISNALDSLQPLTN